MIEPVTYALFLSTGERISVSEFDPERIPLMREREVLAACRGILSRCTFAPRQALEDAKAGYDKQLAPLLRGPDGAMIRAEPPVCRLIRECAMASRDECTLRRSKGKFGLFPICWEYAPPDRLSVPVALAAVELGTAVGQAWRDGHYPVIVGLTAADVG